MLYEWGLIGLFLTCFLSASIIPFSSDVVLSTYFLSGFAPVPALIVATGGNFLGSLTNYWIGFFIARKQKEVPKNLTKWKEYSDKFGPLIGLIAWVPFVGEIMVIALGYLRIKFWWLAGFIFIGVFGRYLVWYFLFTA